jgi:DNA-binding CsgD family transcriptional regulator
MHAEGTLYLFDSCDTCEMSEIIEETARLLRPFEPASFFYLGLRVPGCEMSREPSSLVLTSHPLQQPIDYCCKSRCLNNPAVQRASSSRVPLLLAPHDVIVFLSAVSSMNTPPVRSAVVTPIHGPEDELAIFAVLGDWNWAEPTAAEIDVRSLQMLAFRVHATVVECALKSSGICAVTLTDREKECLVLTAQGKTAWEISRILGRSRGTVNFHLQNAMRKLDSVNKTQAAARAIEARLIH